MDVSGAVGLSPVLVDVESLERSWVKWVDTIGWIQAIMLSQTDMWCRMNTTGLNQVELLHKWYAV